MATWARQKVWNFGDILTSGDLNNEFNNILNAGTFDFAWTGVQTFAAGVAKFKGIGTGIATITNTNTANNRVHTLPDTGGDDIFMMSSGTFTQGSVVFAGASGILSQDNTNLFWDNTNKRLGIGINSALQGKIHVKGGGAVRDGGWNSSVEVTPNGDFASIVFSGQTNALYGAISWNISTSGADATKELANITALYDGVSSVSFSIFVNSTVGTSPISGKGLTYVGSLFGMVLGDVSGSPGGTLTLKQVAITSGNFKLFEAIGAAHTGLTASAEIVDVDINLARTVQRAVGAVATQRAMRVRAPTYSFVGGSTITKAATVAISGSPVAGTNATITNSYALMTEDGTNRFQISASGGGTALTLINTSTAAAATKTATLLFQSTDTVGTEKQTVSLNPVLGDNDAVNVSLDIYTRASDVLAQRVRVASTGDVLINTTSDDSQLSINQRTVTSGTLRGIKFTGAPHTGLTLSTENRDLDINLARTVQWATGALATQRACYIQAPTYAFVGGSTITDGATVAISGAPVAGTNATITNPMALRVESGVSSFGGAVGINNKFPSKTLYVNSSLATDGIVIDSSGGNPFLGVAVSGTNKCSLGVSTSAGAYLLDSASNDVCLRADDGTKQVRIGAGSNKSTAQATSTAFNIGAPTVVSSGTPTLMTVTGAAHTGQTLSTEVPQINFNLAQTRQWATGNFAAQREVKIAAPTYSAVGASTITAAATLYVSGAPSAGTNMTLTNTYSAWFGSSIRIDNTIALGGGAAPTLGTIGGSGPATAAQNSWIQFDDATGKKWVPAWR